MKLVVIIVLVVFCITFLGVMGICGEESRGLDLEDIMTVDQIKPGMKGIGKTVFRGTKIEEFNIEILGLIPNWSTGKTVILARLSGGVVDRAGVIAGMSGSPVYIDGRLIGACAYAWGFAKEPIVGITPIEYMLDLLKEDFSQPKTLDLLASIGVGFNNETSSGSNMMERGETPGAWNSKVLNVPETFGGNMHPLRLPLVISGSRNYGMMSMWQQKLGPLGFTMVQGGSMGTSSGNEDSLEPGSVLGVQLVGGDLNLTAMGTVTYKQGDKILAFGHPMFLMGHVDLPMTSGYIQAIMPSQMISFKMGSAGKVLGSLRQDRSPGIAGILGPPPFMIPFKLNLKDENNNQSRAFNFDIARVPGLTPVLLFIAISDTIENYRKTKGKFYARLSWTIELEGLPTVKNNDFVSGLNGLDTASAKSLARQVQLLELNPFQPVKIISIKQDLVVGERMLQVNLESARLSRKSYEPGGDVKIYMKYRQYKNKTKKFKTQLALPDDVQPGQYELSISDASRAYMNDLKRAPSLYQSNDIYNLIEKLNKVYSHNQLILEIWKTSPSLAINGAEYSRIPGSIFQVLGSTPQSGKVTIIKKSLVLRKIIDTNYNISGYETIPFQVALKNAQGR